MEPEKKTVALNDLYQAVGAALHKVQLVEYSIISCLLLASRSGYIEKNEELFERYWSKKTLGALLNPMIESKLLPEDAMLFLGTLVAARNHLAHSIFTSSYDISDENESIRFMWEISAMQSVFDRAYGLFDQVLERLEKEQGVDYKQVKSKAREMVLQMAYSKDI